MIVTGISLIDRLRLLMYKGYWINTFEKDVPRLYIKYMGGAIYVIKESRK